MLFRSTVVGTHLPPLNLPNLSQKRLRELQALALREFYLRPKIIFRTALKMTSIHALKSYFTGVKLLLTLSLAQRNPFKKKAILLATK